MRSGMQYTSEMNFKNTFYGYVTIVKWEGLILSLRGWYWSVGVLIVTQHTSNNFLMLQMKEENTCENPQVRSERELIMITIGLQYQLLFRVQQLHNKTISPTLVWRAVTRRTASQPQWNNLWNQRWECLDSLSLKRSSKNSQRHFDVCDNGIKEVAEKHREHLVKMQLLTLSALLVAATISTVASDKGN